MDTHSHYRAEAEKMRMKASAYKQYGDAAILSLVLEALPQVRVISQINHFRCLMMFYLVLASYTNILCFRRD